MSLRFACAAVHWPTFAQEWRESYSKFTSAQANCQGDDPATFKTVDDHHHESLRALLAQYEITELWTDEEVLAISRVWHYLDGWPDSSPALQALKDRGLKVCTLSNGNLSLLKDMAEFTSLPWTNVFSAEQFRAYKPDPSVYLGACKKLGLEPSECAMVAAHLGDLQAAKRCGLQTIYIERPDEESWPAEKVKEAKQQDWVDMWIGIKENAMDGGILEVVRKMESR